MTQFRLTKLPAHLKTAETLSIAVSVFIPACAEATCTSYNKLRSFYNSMYYCRFLILDSVACMSTSSMATIYFCHDGCMMLTPDLHGVVYIAPSKMVYKGIFMSESNIINFSLKKEGRPESINRVYRASFIRASKAQKDSFKSSRCMFLVSIDQHYHDGAKLEAALKYVSRYFKEIIIFVGDAIQRYTYAMRQNKSPEEMLSLAEDAGSKWIERNIDIIQRAVTKPYKITRCSHYANDHRFALYYEQIDSACRSDAEYGAQFILDAKAFLSRASNGDIRLAPNSEEWCFQYLKEECTYMRLFMEERHTFFAYPYGALNVAEQTCERYIKRPHPNFPYNVSYCIKAKRNNSVTNLTAYI